MKTSGPIKPWYQRAASYAGNAALGGGAAIAGAMYSLSKTAVKTYSRVPASVKLPLEAASLYLLSPLGATYTVMAGAGLAARRINQMTTPEQRTASIQAIKNKAHAIWENSPKLQAAAGQVKEGVSSAMGNAPPVVKDIYRACTGAPLNAFGHRVSIRDSSQKKPFEFLDNADKILVSMESKIPLQHRGAIPYEADPLPLVDALDAEDPFHRGGVPDLDALLNHASLPPAVLPDEAQLLSDPPAATNAQFNALIGNLEAAIPLYAMIALSNIEKVPNVGDINRMIQLHRTGEITTDSNGNQTTKKLSLKEIFLKEFGKELSLYRKWKIWFYHKLLASEIFTKTIRTFGMHILTQIRERLVNQAWSEQGNIVKALIEDLSILFDTYAKNDTTKKRQDAFDKEFELQFGTLCNKFSETTIRNLAPNITYVSGNWFLPRWINHALNCAVQWVIRSYLPTGIQSVINQTVSVTTPYYLPYAKALTDTATSLLEQLEPNLGQDPSPLTKPVAGTERLPELVEKLFEALRKTGQRPHITMLDQKVQDGIKEATRNGTHFLLRYLAVPANSELMFTKLFELMNQPFVDGKEVTLVDYNQSKAILGNRIHTVGGIIAENAVRELITSSATPSAKMMKMEHDAFEEHRSNAETAGYRMTFLSDAMNDKVQRMLSGEDLHRELFSDIDSMRKVLEDFSIKEHAGDSELLSPAAREGILQSLTPLYESVEGITQHLHRLLIELRSLHAQDQFLDALYSFEEIIRIYSPKVGQGERLQEIVNQIKFSLPPDNEYAVKIREWLDVKTKLLQGFYRESEEQTKNMQTADRILNNIHHLIHRTQPQQRMMEELRLDISLLPSEDQPRIREDLKNFLENLRSSSPQALGNRRQLETAVNSTALRLNMHYENQLYIIQDKHLRTQAAEISDKFVSPLSRMHTEHQSRHRDALIQSCSELQSAIPKFRALVSTVQKETQIVLGNTHFGLIGSAATLGLAALSAPIISMPLAAGAVAAGLHSATNQVGPILQEGAPATFSAAKVATSAILGGLTATLAAQIPLIGVPLALTGAAYVGKNAGKNAVNNVGTSVRDEITPMVKQFCGDAYEFAFKGEIYRQLTQIAMDIVIRSFRKQ